MSTAKQNWLERLRTAERPFPIVWSVNGHSSDNTTEINFPVGQKWAGPYTVAQILETVEALAKTHPEVEIWDVVDLYEPDAQGMYRNPHAPGLNLRYFNGEWITGTKNIQMETRRYKAL